MKNITLILHNVRSTHNVGSIFRTADAMGVSRVFLTGYTPAPIDRFGRVVKDIHKTALGAQEYVPWQQGEIRTILAQLKGDGYTLVALEQDDRSVSVATYQPDAKTALIVGNEVRGVSKQLRNACRVILEIPMCGKKESLNVSVATGVALYALRNTSS